MKDKKQVINLFIDTNIFLKFYDFHDEDLEQLLKLVNLIKQGEIKLYATKQVEEEIRRNRDVKVAGAYQKFKESEITFSMPVMCKTYPEYMEIKKIQKCLKEKKSELSKKIWNDIVCRKLKADEVISNLLDEAKILESDDVLEKAIKRYKLGNPPGKKKRSYGDEINWEALLNLAPNEDMVLISKDGDYKSALSENEINYFLLEEWQEKKKSKMFFYQSLTAFFNEYNIEIQLQWEEEKNDLIETLINSTNFLTTHEIIRRLSKFRSFSDEQVKGLVNAAISNAQVNWIVEDHDVKSFYTDVLSDKESVFDNDTWKEIESLFFKKESDANKNDLPDDDMDFNDAPF